MGDQRNSDIPLLGVLEGHNKENREEETSEELIKYM